MTIQEYPDREHVHRLPFLAYREQYPILLLVSCHHRFRNFVRMASSCSEELGYQDRRYFKCSRERERNGEFQWEE